MKPCGAPSSSTCCRKESTASSVPYSSRCSCLTTVTLTFWPVFTTKPLAYKPGASPQSLSPSGLCSQQSHWLANDPQDACGQMREGEEGGGGR